MGAAKDKYSKVGTGLHMRAVRCWGQKCPGRHWEEEIKTVHGVQMETQMEWGLPELRRS